MTGQLTHLLPVLVAVIVANLVARRLGPSIYETLIALKKLPHLPTMIQKSSAAHKVLVQDFMDREILYVWPNCTYRFLKHLLDNNLHWNEFPFLKSPESMIFLGTITRSEIELILSKFLNHRRRTELAKSRIEKQNNSSPFTSTMNNNRNENNNEPDKIKISFDEVHKNPLVVSATTMLNKLSESSFLFTLCIKGSLIHFSPLLYLFVLIPSSFLLSQKFSFILLCS